MSTGGVNIFASSVVYFAGSGSSVEFVKSVGYEFVRLWNILYILSVSDQPRIVVRDADEGAEFVGGFWFKPASISCVNVGMRISPLYSLWLLRGAISTVLVNGVMYFEYYSYLDEVFSISRDVKVALLSATLATYYVNMRSWFDEFSVRYGVRYQIRSLLSVDDVFDESMRKRVRMLRCDELRNIRVHRFLGLLPRWLLSSFVSRLDRDARELLEFIRRKRNRGVVIVAQNKASARYLAKVISGGLGVRPEVLDSGFYFRGRVLVTWLRSKLNRGVNIHDVDPGFVARYFVFVGSFLSPVRRVKCYERSELSSGNVFSLPWVEDRYFCVEPVDEIYGTEVLCWIEQFLGRSLRVSKFFNVWVYVFVSGDVLRFGAGIYTLAVAALPEYSDVESALDAAFREFVEAMRKSETARDGEYKEMLRRRAERWLRRALDVRYLLEESGGLLDSPFGYTPSDVRIVAPWLWREYVGRIECAFEGSVYGGEEKLVPSPV